MEYHYFGGHLCFFSSISCRQNSTTVKGLLVLNVLQAYVVPVVQVVNVLQVVQVVTHLQVVQVVNVLRVAQVVRIIQVVHAMTMCFVL